jgi:hypothetical protein
MSYVRLRRHQRIPYIAGCSASLTLRPKRTQPQFAVRAAVQDAFRDDQRGVNFDEL